MQKERNRIVPDIPMLDNLDIDNGRLLPCPKCGAHKWTVRGGDVNGQDLFIRNRVRCRSCNYDCPMRDVYI